MRYKEQLRRQRARRAEGQSTILQHGNKLVPLSVEEMDLSEKEILKNVQRESFPEEVLNPSMIKRSSTIVKLDAKMIDGLLRVGGQLRHAPIESDAKYPIILPKLTELLIREYHEKCDHSGLEYVLSQLRQRFWIVKARSSIRRVLDSCFSSRRRQAPFGTQKMADLPKDRVTPDLPLYQCGCGLLWPNHYSPWQKHRETLWRPVYMPFMSRHTYRSSPQSRHRLLRKCNEKIYLEEGST